MIHSFVHDCIRSVVSCAGPLAENDPRPTPTRARMVLSRTNDHLDASAILYLPYTSLVWAWNGIITPNGED